MKDMGIIQVNNTTNLPNIYDTDDDNDSIPTSVEVQNHLDPFNPADANGDLDHDGLNNSFEYHHGLNMQDPDTDHDGIDDGAEYHYWQNKLKKVHPDWSNETINDTAISYCKIPDVDGDNITDGKEIKGYSVKIIVGWKSDGTPISEMRYISPDEMDPLIPYANSTGVWTDTDKDGIPDIAEIYLSNRSLWDKFRTEYSELWNNYSWVSSYFWTVYRKDYNEHHNSTAAMQNATNWLRNQFNPLIVEHTPPQVLKFNVKFYYYLLTAYVEYHVIVVDAGKISRVAFWNLDNGDVKVFTPNSGYLEFSGSFFATPWGANLGFKLKLFARDIAGNKMTVEKEIKGPVGQWIEVLAKIWSEIWNTLVKVGKAIAKAVNVFISILKWLVGKLYDIFSATISVIYGEFLHGVANIISQGLGLSSGGSKLAYVKDGNSNNVIGGIVIKILKLILIGGILYRIATLDSVLIALEGTISWVTMGIGAFMKKIAEKFMMINIKTIVKSIAGATFGGAITLLIGALLAGGGTGIIRTLGDILKLPSDVEDLLTDALYATATFISGLYTKKLILFYIALVASTIGLTFTVLQNLLPPMTHQGRIWVDAILLTVNVIGFGALMVALKSTENKWRDIVDGMVTLLEIMASIGSIIALGIYLCKDISDNSGGG